MWQRNGLRSKNPIALAVGVSRLLPKYNEEEKAEDINTFTITAIKRWKRSDTLDRIYINNSLNKSIFFDVVNQNWSCGMYDESEMQDKVFAFASVSSIEELIRFAK